MSLLELIIALLWAVHGNDTAATARLLNQLEKQLHPADLVNLLEAILGEQPWTPGRTVGVRPLLVACA
jgi:hypothetical protein